MAPSPYNLILVISLSSLLGPALSQDLALVHTEAGEASVTSDDAEDGPPVSSDQVFVATEEWQEVRPGQAVPGGLHVRMNLETGKKEAKILEEAKDNSLWKEGGLNHEALKEAMKNIKADDNNEGKTEFDPYRFRSMDELKNALGDVQLNMKTDMELLTKLINEFKETQDDVDKVTILEDLEYYVHQYDNALLFVDMGGLKDVIIPSLNSSNPQIRLHSCLLLSGAAQSNPKFQISALESGLLETLLRMTTLDPDPSVSTKAFSALSAIMRNFPEAQNTLLRQGGLGVLVKLFNNEEKSYEKLKVKILTLISDLLVERETVAASEDETSLMRKSQFNDIDKKFSLESQILEHGWCSVFSKTLVLPRSDRQAKRYAKRKEEHKIKVTVFFTGMTSCQQLVMISRCGWSMTLSRNY